jgi:hypothetical protein
MRDLPDEVQAALDANDPMTPWPSGNRSAVYRHCFEVRRREMAGSHWSAAEARTKAAAVYTADGLDVPAMPRAFR